METQYPYSEEDPSRPPFQMIRTMQPNQPPRNYPFDHERQRSNVQSSHGYISPNGYAQSGSQLPPLNSRSGSSSSGPVGYGQIQHSRSQQASPASNSMPFPMPSYPAQTPAFSQPSYSTATTHYASPVGFQQQNPYGFPGSSIPYHASYAAPVSGMPDFQGLNSTASHAPLIPNSMPPQTYALAAESDYARTHVVGAQGRRGILPSDEGRPSALGKQVGPKGSLAPQKDSNGKFPCQHCNKTYLHAKHLKRHMLRRMCFNSRMAG